MHILLSHGQCEGSPAKHEFHGFSPATQHREVVVDMSNGGHAAGVTPIRHTKISIPGRRDSVLDFEEL